MILRLVLVLAVIGYAGWLVWPVLSPFLEDARPGSISGSAGAAVSGGGLSEMALWIGAVALYLIAALMLAARNPWAATPYFLGFFADAVRRLAIHQRGEVPDGMGADIAARSAETMAMAGVSIDPTWLILGVLLFVGLLIAAVSLQKRRPRVPAHFAS